MTGEEARFLLKRTLNEWMADSFKILLDVSPMKGQDDKMFYFDAFFQDRESKEEWAVPYGVEKATGEVENCSVDAN